MQKLYVNGTILTMENNGEQTEALLVKDGLIQATGRREELEKLGGRQAQLIDLQGHTLMPSFLDGHGHITMMAQMSQCADLSGCERLEDIVTVLREYIREKQPPEGKPVMGFGYDHTLLAEERHPDRRLLDRVSDTRPVYAGHTSGHMGCANSVLLRQAGITADSPDPEGGVIGRLEDGREPDGYLEESGMMLLKDILSEGSQDMDFQRALQEAQMTYLRNGITTVQDGATNAAMLQLLHQEAQKEKLLVDVVSYPLMTEGAREMWERFPECAGRYEGRLKIGGYKLILDGSPQGKSAWLTKPYEGESEYRGYPWMTDEEALAFMKQAVDDKVQLLVHCNGDAAADQYLRCYAQALRESANPDKNNLRPVMIHCQTVRDDQLDEMARLSMIPSVFVAHVYYWGDIHLKNLGWERGSHISPVRLAMERGLCVNFHQDAPVVRPLMLHTVWIAVNRVSRKGKVIGEEQRIGVYEALQAITINTAYMYGEEDKKGTLRPGKLADMVILDQNPLTVPPMELDKIKILETIKEGKTLYQRKEREDGNRNENWNGDQNAD